jgi:very-short-patch-repair endonuclease
MKTPIHNVESKREFAAQMRTRPTLAEEALWCHLRRKQTGFIFRRQSLQRGYILDFYCPSLKLAIEVDGSVHMLPDQSSRDAQKESALVDCGIKVLRFCNQDVLDFPSVVMTRIETTLKALSGAIQVEPCNQDSSRSRHGAKVEELPVEASSNDWRGLRAVLNRYENLSRPKEIPAEMRITRQDAEQLVAATRNLLRFSRQRSLEMQVDDNRTMQEKAYSQLQRLDWYLKHERPDLGKRLAESEPQTLSVAKGMFVVEKKQA